MSFITVEKPRTHVTQITLNRPDRMNAMAFDVMAPFKEALEEVSFDNDTRVVIITGAGEGFCSGADLVDPGWLDIFDGLTVPGIARRAILWAGMEAGSLHSHMNHEGHAQLFVRMTTKNFEEAIKARKEDRAPNFKD